MVVAVSESRTEDGVKACEPCEMKRRATTRKDFMMLSMRSCLFVCLFVVNNSVVVLDESVIVFCSSIEFCEKMGRMENRMDNRFFFSSLFSRFDCDDVPN